MTIFSAFAALFILSSCASPIVDSGGGTARKREKVTSVALVPLLYHWGGSGGRSNGQAIVKFNYDSATSIPERRGEGSGNYILRGESERESVVRFFYRSIEEEAKVKLSGVKVMSYPKDNLELLNIAVQGPYPDYKRAALGACKWIGAQTVLIGAIGLFRDRQGGEYGVTSPAAVTCEVQLLDCSTGALLWEDYFNETQQPLFWNLLDIRKFLQRKGKWITAQQLAREGIGKVLNNMSQYLEGK